MNHDFYPLSVNTQNLSTRLKVDYDTCAISFVKVIDSAQSTKYLFTLQLQFTFTYLTQTANKGNNLIWIDKYTNT